MGVRRIGSRRVSGCPKASTTRLRSCPETELLILKLISCSLPQVRNHRTELLHHPLTLALIRHKWKIAQYYFFAFLLFYTTFVGLVTSFMISNLPPNKSLHRYHFIPRLPLSLQELSILPCSEYCWLAMWPMEMFMRQASTTFVKTFSAATTPLRLGRSTRCARRGRNN